MTSMFCAVSYIKNVSGVKVRTGTAIYRTGEDEFVEYTFKAFFSDEPSLVEEISKTSVSLVIGRFALENEELCVRKNRFKLCSISNNVWLIKVPHLLIRLQLYNMFP